MTEPRRHAFIVLTAGQVSHELAPIFGTRRSAGARAVSVFLDERSFRPMRARASTCRGNSTQRTKPPDGQVTAGPFR